jgi:cysteine desulfuration protein SufE
MYKNVEIMNLTEKQQEIIDEFSVYEDWMDKYEYIIDLGKDLPEIDESLKIPERLIDGCQSKVWLESEFIDGKMKYTADSDAIIAKGIVALLIRVLNNEKPEDIVVCDLHFINEIGLQEHLSPTRANGLLSMVKRMKLNALKAVSQK